MRPSPLDRYQPAASASATALAVVAWLEHAYPSDSGSAFYHESTGAVLLLFAVLYPLSAFGQAAMRALLRRRRPPGANH
jgi:hypothetical protein